MSPTQGELSRVTIARERVKEGQPAFFQFERAGEPLTGFVLLHEGAFYAYVNRCPHVPYSLDFGDEEVMDESGKFVFCQTHGARFLPESGECFWGPPMGLSLEQLPCNEMSEGLVVSIMPEPEDWP